MSDETERPVTLLTAHLAKGLEFPVVFVAGMFEGGFPHFMSREREEDIEEERRLVYVAFTRAKERLYLSCPRRRRMPQGYYADVAPSRFLGELPRELMQIRGQLRSSALMGGASRGERLKRLGFGDQQPPRQAAPAQRRFRAPPTKTSPAPPENSARGRVMTRTPESAGDFRPGIEVMHPTFGSGVIKRCEGAPHNLKLHVHFDRCGRKTLYARYARLEIVER